MFSLHSRQNASTGQSPSHLLLGAPLVQPGGWSHPVNQQQRQNDAIAREQRIQRARKHQLEFQRNLYPEPREAPRYFQPGDQVLVRSFPGVHTAFGPTWEGPYTVIEVLGDGVYVVDRDGAQDRVHIDDLRPFPGQPSDHVAEVDVFTHPPDDCNEKSLGESRGMEAAVQDPAGEEVDFQTIDEPDESVTSQKLSTSSVFMEDASDSEDEKVGKCQSMGIPIVGLFP